MKLQDGFEYHPPAQFDPTTSKHQVNHDVSEMAYLVGAFKKLGLEYCEKKARTALSYMLYVDNILSKIMNVLDGEGIASLEVVIYLCYTSNLLLKVDEMKGCRLKRAKEKKKSDDQRAMIRRAKL